MEKDPHSPRLDDLLRRAGWRAQGGRWVHAGKRYVVAGLGFAQTWERHARALLSQAILMARARAGKDDVEPVAALEVPRATPLLDSRLDGFVRAELGLADQGWLLFDAHGQVFAHLPHDATFAQRTARGAPPHPPVTRKRPFNLFSDMNQWLLKVLLAPQVPERLLSAPRDEPVRTTTQLATFAGASLPAASRLLNALEEEGQLDRRSGDLRIAEPLELLQRWRDRMPPPGSADVGARFVRGAPDAKGLRALLARHAGTGGGSDGERTILGLFSACEALGQGHVVGVPPLLYVPDLAPGRLAELGLVADPNATAFDVVLRVPRFPRSVDRGAVLASGAPVTDIIQCWLDVSHFRVRGAEQAEFLWRRVLAPLWKR